MLKTRPERIEEKLDILLEKAGEHSQHFKNLNGTIKKHDKDIEHFKTFEYQFMGGLGVITFLISVCGVYIYYFA